MKDVQVSEKLTDMLVGCPDRFPVKLKTTNVSLGIFSGHSSWKKARTHT